MSEIGETRMTQLFNVIFKLSWALGLLSILVAVLIKALALEARLTVTSHTAFLIAGTFFLCALATREMQRMQSS
jgi:uncharacterized membrane protein